MRTGSWKAAALMAAALTFTDLAGRLLIAQRLPAAASPSMVTGAALFAVISVTFGVAMLVRADALSLIGPAAGLLVVGDLIAVRMHASGAFTPPAAGIACAVVFGVGLIAVRDSRRLADHALLLGWAGVVLIAAPLLPVLGAGIGGQQIAVHVGSALVMPGELGRPLVMLGFAAALARLPFPEGADISLRDVRPEITNALTLPVAAVFVHLAERDLGPAVLLGAATMMTVAVATGRIRWIAGSAMLLLYVLALGASMSDRISSRVADILDPLRLQGGAFDQAGLAHLGLAWGHWWGTGLGGGVAAPGRQGSVPLGGTDLALASWGTETGLVGLAVVLALFTALLWALFSFGLRAPRGFPRLAGCALASLVGVQVIWVTGAVLGLLPLSGVATPLVSGGRSAPLALALVLALACRLPEEHGPVQHLRGLDPLHTGRLLRMGAAMAIIAVAITAAARINAQAQHLNRLVDNPLRQLATVRRGSIFDHDGTRLAWTTGAGSLETVARRYAAADADIVGRMSVVNAGDGVERAWGAALRCAGSGQAAADHPSEQVLGDPAQCRPADLHLTIDGRLQQAVLRALGARTGAVAVIDTDDGAVLALAGRNLSTPGQPAGLKLGAQTAEAPGSTFKVVIAAAALTKGIDTSTPVRASWLVPGGPKVRNAGGEICGGGWQQALASSCNTSFADIALRTGARPLASIALKLGFFAPPPLSGLPTALTETAPAVATGAQVAVSGFGQGLVIASPLQMARVAAAVAGGGMLPTTGVVDRVCADGRTLGRPPRPRQRALSAAVARQLVGGMRQVAISGTAHALRLPGQWAVKTGTAELPALGDARTPAGTAGWIIGFPTRGPSAGHVAVAVLALPDASNRQRNGPMDGVSVLESVGTAAAAADLRHRDSTGEC